jgi:hypothetical protein
MSQADDQMHSYLEIATASIRIFANDGTIDHQDLDEAGGDGTRILSRPPRSDRQGCATL